MVRLPIEAVRPFTSMTRQDSSFIALKLLSRPACSAPPEVNGGVGRRGPGRRVSWKQESLFNRQLFWHRHHHFIAGSSGPSWILGVKLKDTQQPISLFGVPTISEPPAPLVERWPGTAGGKPRRPNICDFWTNYSKYRKKLNFPAFSMSLLANKVNLQRQWWHHWAGNDRRLTLLH